MKNYLTDNEQNMVSGGMEIWAPENKNDYWTHNAVFFETQEELNKFLDFYTREHGDNATNAFRQNLNIYQNDSGSWEASALVPIIDLDNFLLSFPGVSINDGLNYYLKGRVYKMSED